jgi:hypothetical protein
MVLNEAWFMLNWNGTHTGAPKFTMQFMKSVCMTLQLAPVYSECTQNQRYNVS